MGFQDRYKPCHICQASAFIWGDPSAESGVWFQTEDPARKQLGSASGWFGKHGFIVRVCRGCGNAQWFLKYYPQSDQQQSTPESPF